MSAKKCQQQHSIFCQINSGDVEVKSYHNFNVSATDLAEYGVLLLKIVTTDGDNKHFSTVPIQTLTFQCHDPKHHDIQRWNDTEAPD